MTQAVTKQTAFNILWADAAILYHYDKKDERHVLPNQIAALIHSPEIRHLMTSLKEELHFALKYFPLNYNELQSDPQKMKM